MCGLQTCHHTGPGTPGFQGKGTIFMQGRGQGLLGHTVAPAQVGNNPLTIANCEGRGTAAAA